MYIGSHFHNQLHLGFTLGVVVDTNDPQQTGRIRVLVPSYGDRPDFPISEIPWAVYVSPFAGTINNEKMKRGTEEESTPGPLAYGFWNIPKIGSTVVVTCLDGNPATRVWIGCVHTERLVHTLPHGRFLYDEKSGEPEGPLDSKEQPIQPLYKNYSKAFGNKLNNYEWRTRGADYTVSATAEDFYLNDNISKKTDPKDFQFKSKDGKTFNVRQGYALSQIEPELKTQTTDKNLDPQVYSWTTPGFHSISMDDRKENCRVRIRTTAGHQIIFDDTNERIYINTCEGNNWIELDQDGNIDIYASTKVNVRSEGDINFTADKTIRLHAKQAIHMYTENMRIHTKAEFHLRTDAETRIHAKKDLFVETDKSLHAKVGAEGMITTGGTLHLKAGGQILEQGSQIHLNGPTPTSASPSKARYAKWTNRVPAHEPYARMSIKFDGAGNAGDENKVDSSTVGTHEPKYQYDDPAIGSEHKSRGKYWRR